MNDERQTDAVAQSIRLPRKDRKKSPAGTASQPRDTEDSPRCTRMLKYYWEQQLLSISCFKLSSSSSSKTQIKTIDGNHRGTHTHTHTHTVGESLKKEREEVGEGGYSPLIQHPRGRAGKYSSDCCDSIWAHCRRDCDRVIDLTFCYRLCSASNGSRTCD